MNTSSTKASACARIASMRSCSGPEIRLVAMCASVMSCISLGVGFLKPFASAKCAVKLAELEHAAAYPGDAEPLVPRRIDSPAIESPWG